jgi:hypothetical protein
MSVIKLDLKHGRTLEEARAQLERAVADVHSRFGSLVQRTDWSADRNAVKLSGTGFEVDIRVDAQEVHLTGDLFGLGALLAGPWMSGVKAIVQQSFQKRLPGQV